jgi:hypothetical protein
VVEKGKPDYEGCKKDEDCESNICVKMKQIAVGKGGRICRPVKGFAKGRPCFRGLLGNNNDCNTEAKNFCYGEPNAIGFMKRKGICADQAVDNMPCLNSAGCRSGVCAKTNAQSLVATVASCSFAKGRVKEWGLKGEPVSRCHCRPQDGFPIGAVVRFKKDCESGENKDLRGSDPGGKGKGKNKGKLELVQQRFIKKIGQAIGGAVKAVKNAAGLNLGWQKRFCSEPTDEEEGDSSAKGKGKRR